MNKLEILPVKKLKMDEDNNVKKKIHDHLLKPPFLLILCAPVRSGKSNMIMNLIYNDRFYKGIFDHIVYISPTVDNDKTLSFLREDDDIVKISQNLEDGKAIIDALIKLQTDDDNKESMLVVFDDMLGNLKAKDFGNFCSRYRHYRISMIITTQNFRSLPPTCRNNATGYVIFKTNNGKEYSKIHEELSGSFKRFDSLYNQATKKKYNFLYLDLESIKAYHNFDKLLWSKDDDYKDSGDELP